MNTRDIDMVGASSTASTPAGTVDGGHTAGDVPGVAPDPRSVTKVPWRADAIDGVRAMLPWLLGVAPFGLVVGMTAVSSGAPASVGMATGATIYSGSAQLTAIGLLANGAEIFVVVVSVLAVNARLVLYGSSIAPHWRGTRTVFRLGAAYLLVDPSYAVGMHRYGDPRPGGHVHYVAAGITLWLGWHGAMLAGAVFGSGVPAWLSLELTIPLFLVAELVQSARTRPAVTAAIAAATVTIAGNDLPLHSGLLAAVVVGVGAATVTEGVRP